MNTGVLDNLHAKYYEAFKRAEEAVKSAEHAGEDLPIPCINELRYAGYHHIRADKFFKDGDTQKAEEEMLKAIRHANRANFDVLEFYIAVYSEKTKAIIESYKGYEYLAARHIPNYKEHIATVNQIGNIIENTHAIDKESPDYIEYCTGICKRLKAFADAFYSVEDTLLSEIADKESSRKRSWKQCVVGIIGGFVLAEILQRLKEWV